MLKICCILIKPIYQVNNYRKCVFENRYFLSIKCVTSKFHFLLGMIFCFISQLSSNVNSDMWGTLKQSKTKNGISYRSKATTFRLEIIKGWKKRKEKAFKWGFADGSGVVVVHGISNLVLWKCQPGFVVYYLCSKFCHSSGQRKQKNEKNRKRVIKIYIFFFVSSGQFSFDAECEKNRFFCREIKKVGNLW